MTRAQYIWHWLTHVLHYLRGGSPAYRREKRKQVWRLTRKLVGVQK